MDTRTKGKGVWKDQQFDKNSQTEREAKARILNERLKVLLGWVSWKNVWVFSIKKIYLRSFKIIQWLLLKLIDD